MKIEDFEKLKKGATLFAAALDFDETKIVVTTYTLVGITQKSFCLVSCHGSRMMGRNYNYPTLIGQMALTPQHAVDHLVRVADIEIERAQERLKVKTARRALLTGLIERGSECIVHLKSKEK